MPNIRSIYTDSLNFFGAEDPVDLAARFGTPLYVYNEKVLRQRCRDMMNLSDHPGFRVNYSAKANTNPVLLQIVRDEGCLVDAMSPGELYMNQRAGFLPEEMLYVSNNISAAEMSNALDHGLLISVDSLSQLDRLGGLNPGGDVMVRFNPGIGAGHSEKVITAGKKTKFGINPQDLPQVLDLLKKHNLRLAGVNQHIGSLFMDGASYLAAADILLELTVGLLKLEIGKDLRIIDFGGGFGIPYEKYSGQPSLDLADLGARLDTRLKKWTAETGYTGQFFIEPGRYIAAECGLLLGRVQAVKKNGGDVYVGTTLGFNVMQRAAMYGAFHDIEIYRAGGSPEPDALVQTIVGNICESGDIIAKDRLLPPAKEGDVLAVLDAGAYGYVMASTYNQRLRPAEVLIQKDGRARQIRRRESLDDLAALLM